VVEQSEAPSMNINPSTEIPMRITQTGPPKAAGTTAHAEDNIHFLAKAIDITFAGAMGTTRGCTPT